MKKEKDYSIYFPVIENLEIKALRSSVDITRDMAYKLKRGETLPSLVKAVKLEEDFLIPSSTWVYFKDHKAKESKSA